MVIQHAAVCCVPQNEVLYEPQNKVLYILGKKKVVAPNKQRFTSYESAQNSAVCESWVLKAAGLLHSLV